MSAYIDEQGQNDLYSFRIRTSQAHLYDIDRRSWDAFDARVARAADVAMGAVDAQTIGLFRKYGVEMPADFARERDTRWRGDTMVPREALQARHLNADLVRDRAARSAQATKDRADINQAIIATDGRRRGKTPAEYYKLKPAKTNPLDCKVEC